MWMYKLDTHLRFCTSEVSICSGLPFWVRVAFGISCVSLRVVVPYSFKITPLIFSGSPYNPACNAPLFPQDTSGYERSSLSFTDSALAQMKDCTLLATYLRLKKMYPSTAFFNFQKALWIIQWGFVRLSHLHTSGVLYSSWEMTGEDICCASCCRMSFSAARYRTVAKIWPLYSTFIGLHKETSQSNE